MKEIQPKVYLIAYTKINQEGLNDFLNDIQQKDWYSNAITDSDKLLEIAGRICYRSWSVFDENNQEGTNQNITKVREDNQEYIQNIIKQAHGCYDGDTEVLTENGWIAWKNIKGDEIFCTRNKKGLIEYHKAISCYLGKEYKGKMYNVNSKDVDLLVTPNHNMLVCQTTTKIGRLRKEYEFITAENLNNKSHCYIKNGLFVPKYNNYSKDELELIGFSIGDGRLVNNNVEFHLRRKRKIDYLRKLCNKLKLSLIENTQKDLYIVNWPFDFSFKDNSGKFIPEKLLFENNIKGLYDGLINSDGSISLTSIVFDTIHKKLAGQFQQLCLHLGFSANISQANCYKERKNSYGKNPIYRCTVIRRNNKPEVNKFINYKGKTSWIDWNGLIYCVEVPNNTLYVRKNGKPVWCGNSILEHSNISLLFKDVSRVFTHELVRHRSGMSYSQESLRYVRLNNLRFFFPKEIKENSELYQLYKETIEYLEGVQNKLEKITNIDNSKNFHEKKKWTSRFRRLAPLGLATTILATGNLRAWRHIINMRSSTGAEEEIRLVMDQVVPIMKEISPAVFADLHKNPETLTWEYNLNAKP